MKEVMSKYSKLNSILSEIGKKLFYVDLICIHGSQVTGTTVKTSDVDYYVLLSSEKYSSAFLNEVKKKVQSYGERAHYFIWNSQRVSIHVLTTKDMVRYLEDMKKNIEDFKKNQVYARGFVLEAKIIFDRNQIFRRLKQLANPNNKEHLKFFKECFIDSLKKAENKLYHMKRGMSNAFYFIDNLAIIDKYILDALYAKNHTYSIPMFKRAHYDLPKLKPKVDKEMKFISIAKNTPKNMDKKIKLLEKVCEKLKRG